MGRAREPTEEIYFPACLPWLMNAFEFSKHVIELCSKNDFIREIEILLLDEPVVKVKAVISGDTFVNAFYNSETEKYSFALIRGNRRIFGADNTRKWHIHPFENPDSHIETTSVSFSAFLGMLSSDKDKWFVPEPLRT